MTGPTRRRLRTVAGSPWAVMLRHAVVPGVVVLVVIAVIGAAVDGWSGAASAALGGAGVLIPFAATGAVLWAASRISASAPPLVMLGSYLLLAMLGAVLLAVATVPGWVRDGWVVSAVIAQIVVWLAGSAVGLRRARLPVYEPAPTAGSAAAAAQESQQHEPRHGEKERR